MFFVKTLFKPTCFFRKIKKPVALNLPEQICKGYTQVVANCISHDAYGHA